MRRAARECKWRLRRSCRLRRRLVTINRSSRALLEFLRKPFEFLRDERVAAVGGGAAAVLGLAEQILLGGHGLRFQGVLFFFYDVSGRLNARHAAWFRGNGEAGPEQARGGTPHHTRSCTDD